MGQSSPLIYPNPLLCPEIHGESGALPFILAAIIAARCWAAFHQNPESFVEMAQNASCCTVPLN